LALLLDELNYLINYYNLESKKDEIISRCDYWYNNYRFNEDISYTIYNSDMIFYYFDHLIRTKKEPKNLIDTNVRTDYSKLKFLVYSSKKLNGNFELLNNLITCTRCYLYQTLNDNFSCI